MKSISFQKQTGRQSKSLTASSASSSGLHILQTLQEERAWTFGQNLKSGAETAQPSMRRAFGQQLEAVIQSASSLMTLLIRMFYTRMSKTKKPKTGFFKTSCQWQSRTRKSFLWAHSKERMTYIMPLTHPFGL